MISWRWSYNDVHGDDASRWPVVPGSESDNRRGEEIGAVMWSRTARTWTVRCGDWTQEVRP